MMRGYELSAAFPVSTSKHFPFVEPSPSLPFLGHTLSSTERKVAAYTGQLITWVLCQQQQQASSAEDSVLHGVHAESLVDVGLQAHEAPAALKNWEEVERL
eukprot:jgi/Botrbrau1/6204/Bobra.0344s0043.1